MLASRSTSTVIHNKGSRRRKPGVVFQELQDRSTREPARRAFCPSAFCKGRHLTPPEVSGAIKKAANEPQSAAGALRALCLQVAFLMVNARMLIVQCLGDWKRPQRDTAHGKEGSGLQSKTGKQATPSQTTCVSTLAGARGDRPHHTRKQAGWMTAPATIFIYGTTTHRPRHPARRLPGG